MRTVPELVFVNCCHLAATDVARVLKTDLPGLSRTIAPNSPRLWRAQLIDMGVRCVIAAGWAVEDRRRREVRDDLLRRAA